VVRASSAPPAHERKPERATTRPYRIAALLFPSCA
jgi:hypothetical protein